MLPMRKKKPVWMYELLPVIYGGAGMLTVVVLNNTMAYFAGLMLIAAAVTIGWMRASARFGLAENGPVRRSGSGKGLMRLSLGAENETGHALIDGQHRDLCATANALLDHVLHGGTANDAEPLLKELHDDLKQHFVDEERVIVECTGGIDPAHCDSHRELIGKLERLIGNCQRGSAGIKDVVAFVAVDLVAEHFAKLDRPFFASVRKTKA